MKRHSMFEQPPSGFYFYALEDRGDKGLDGIWVPVPVYWILRGWRQLRILYLRWSLRR